MRGDRHRGGQRQSPISIRRTKNQQRATPVRLAVKLLRFSDPVPAGWLGPIGFANISPGGNRSRRLARSTARPVMLYDEATLATIDADGDGTLDQAELAHLEWRPIPNLELTVDQGGEETACRLCHALRPGRTRRGRNRTMMQQPTSARGTSNRPAMCLDPASRFEPAVRIAGVQPAGKARPWEAKKSKCTPADLCAAAFQRRGAQLVDNLKQFDQDKNDYLEEKELRRFGDEQQFHAARYQRRRQIVFQRDRRVCRCAGRCGRRSAGGRSGRS